MNWMPGQTYQVEELHPNKENNKLKDFFQSFNRAYGGVRTGFLSTGVSLRSRRTDQMCCNHSVPRDVFSQTNAAMLLTHRKRAIYLAYNYTRAIHVVYSSITVHGQMKRYMTDAALSMNHVKTMEM